MKKILLFILTATIVATSCNEFDDTAIWDKLREHERRIAQLEELCKQINEDISTLQNLVTALETSDYIVDAYHGIAYGALFFLTPVRQPVKISVRITGDKHTIELHIITHFGQPF